MSMPRVVFAAPAASPTARADAEVRHVRAILGVVLVHRRGTERRALRPTRAPRSTRAAAPRYGRSVVYVFAPAPRGASPTAMMVSPSGSSVRTVALARAASLLTGQKPVSGCHWPT
jgi:hypothetical protein